jgi:hypothetical protein
MKDKTRDMLETEGKTHAMLEKSKIARKRKHTIYT